MLLLYGNGGKTVRIERKSDGFYQELASHILFSPILACSAPGYLAGVGSDY
jgi:hypothetical protein